MSRKMLSCMVLATAATMLLCSCPQDSLAPDSSVVDAAAPDDQKVAENLGEQATDSGEAGEPWDPVWHETKPKEWPVIGPEGQPDCGAGCRVALNGPINHNLYYGHTFTSSAVADADETRIVFAKLASMQTIALTAESSSDEGLGMPYLAGEYVVYSRSARPTTGNPGFVEVMSTTTGESKVVYQYWRKGSGDSGVSFTALNSTYAFWKREGQGLMSRNLKTGELRVLTAADLFCVRVCASETAVICGDQTTAKMLSIDQESGIVTPLDDAPGLQIESGCSADRKQVAWVDYRDPPGLGSDLDFNRSGGEIYMKDLEKNETRRLTFDSPSAPKGKTYASVGDGLVMWREAPPSGSVNPATAQELYGATTTLVVLNLTTNTKCRLERPVISSMLRNSVHGRHIYGYWVPTPGEASRLVDIDLDNTAIECKPYE